MMKVPCALSTHSVCHDLMLEGRERGVEAGIKRERKREGREREEGRGREREGRWREGERERER